jgi:DNA-directed RNA polymerase subunit H (RpoH/RPB5)
MSQVGNLVAQLYKSRITIIAHLKAQGYDTSNYENFGINEVNIMNTMKQMDMLLKKNDEQDSKTYIKYHPQNKILSVKNIREYIDDLFELEEVLKKSDNLIIIIKDEPNETLQKALRNIWQQENIFIIILNIQRLQYNVLEHELVPPHRELNSEEEKTFREKYNITNDKEIPDISRFSPIAQAIGIRPGKICHIIRPSKTAITSNFYRICSS